MKNAAGATIPKKAQSKNAAKRGAVKPVNVINVTE